LEETEKRSAKIVGEKEKLEHNLAALREQYDTLCAKYKKTVDKMKDGEKMNKILLDSKEKVDRKYKQLGLNYSKLVEKLSFLEEELKIAESMQKTKTSMESNQDSNSLLAELQCIDSMHSSESPRMRISIEDSNEDFYTPRCAERRLTYTPNAKSFFRDSENFVVVVGDSFLIPSTKDMRKEPYEEYFILTTQAVKMNSAYMDTVCVVPHLVLFEKAKNENVPFHKWHGWIESQLNNEYIQKLYRNKSYRFQGLKRLLKRF
jgi:hypothetical protein